MKTIVALFVVCAVFGALLAPTTARTQQSNATPAVVKIEGQTITIRQCIKPLDENRQQEVSELMYGQKITNLSNRPIIVYRYAPQPYDVRLSTTLEGIQKAKFQMKERPGVSPKHAREFPEPDPTNQFFRVLQPFQSFLYEYPEILTFLPTELIDGDKKLLVGQFYIQLKVATWLAGTDEAEKLRQRWARHGEFFYHDVITEPFPFTVEKVGANTPRCNNP